MYRLFSIVAARKWVWEFVAICAGINVFPPSPRLLESSETGTLTPLRVTIARTMLLPGCFLLSHAVVGSITTEVVASLLLYTTRRLPRTPGTQLWRRRLLVSVVLPI